MKNIYSYDKNGLPRGPSGRFIKGIIYNPNNKSNTGRHHSKETRQKISKSSLGKPATSGSFKEGHEVPQYVRDKISKSCNKGKTPIFRLLYCRLYDIWTYPILERDNFTCQHCGVKTNLQVHHSNETMADIIEKFMSDNPTAVVKAVMQYHVTNKVEGITLCNGCHRQTPTYGARNRRGA